MESALRKVPAIGVLLETPVGRDMVQRFGRDLAAHALRQATGEARQSAAQGDQSPAADAILTQASRLAVAIAEPSLRPVINATGIVLHTNLGRAPLGRSVLRDIAPIVTGYCNVEFDLASGKRGHRVAHVANLLQFLTGAEGVVAVNNNAAAIILILHTLARGREVVVSRGELIEIGGAFRIPDIMSAAGARMKEVGTTNKTRLSDYEKAVTDRTALIFRAHKSNYSIHGFTEEPSTAELAGLARKHKLPFVFDMGSGLLRRPRRLPLSGEPDVRSALADGADLVCFSGDKLIGGPQAGIIVGRAELTGRLARAPLMRALRLGKLDLAALSSACRRYLSDDTLLADNPVFAMLEQTPGLVKQRAGKLASLLQARAIPCRLEASVGRTGGGALPDLEIASHSVVLTLESKAGKATAEKLYRALMAGGKPVVAVLKEGQLCFDLLTVFDDDVAGLADAIAQAAAA